MQSASQLVESSQGEVPCLGTPRHLEEDELGGAGDRTSDLPVSSHAPLPPEPHAAHTEHRPAPVVVGVRADEGGRDTKRFVT